MIEAFSDRSISLTTLNEIDLLYITTLLMEKATTYGHPMVLLTHFVGKYRQVSDINGKLNTMPRKKIKR